MKTITKQVGEYKIKEVFNEKGKDIQEMLKDVFSIYFMEEYKRLENFEDTT